jgi:histone H3
MTTETQYYGDAPEIKSSPMRRLVYRPRKLAKMREAGVGALSEIRHYQQAGGLLMCKLPFQCLCREVMDELIKSEKGRRNAPIQFQSSAIMALQESKDVHLAGLFEDVNLLVIHFKMVKIQSRDMTIAMIIHNEAKPRF